MFYNRKYYKTHLKNEQSFNDRTTNTKRKLLCSPQYIARPFFHNKQQFCRSLSEIHGKWPTAACYFEVCTMLLKLGKSLFKTSFHLHIRIHGTGKRIEKGREERKLGDYRTSAKIRSRCPVVFLRSSLPCFYPFFSSIER